MKKVKLYVQIGGTMVKTSNVPLVDEILVARIPEIQYAIETNTYPLEIFTPEESYDKIYFAVRKFGVRGVPENPSQSKYIPIYYGGVNSKPIVQLVRKSAIEIQKIVNESLEKAREEVISKLQKATKQELIDQLTLLNKDKSDIEGFQKKLGKLKKNELIEKLCGYLVN